MLRKAVATLPTTTRMRSHGRPASVAGTMPSSAMPSALVMQAITYHCLRLRVRSTSGAYRNLKVWGKKLQPVSTAMVTGSTPERPSK